MEHRKPPHHCDRNDCSSQRVWADVRQAGRLGSLDQHNRSMGAIGKPRSLWKQSAVCQRDAEIRVGFPLDNYSAVDQIVANIEVDHLDVEDTTQSSELDQGRISL